jgi:flagellin
MEVRHNLPNANANRLPKQDDPNRNKTLEKLSSGYHLHSTGDNAAEIAIAEKMRNQTAGIEQAIADTQNGISIVQASAGALNEIQSILSRMKSLAAQYTNDTDRAAIELEYVQLFSEIDKVADTNSDFTAAALGLTAENISLSSPDHAVDTIDNALNKASSIAVELGEAQNRLEHRINNLTATTENLNQAESQIRDTDMASERENFNRNNILRQASQSMLDQKNKLPPNTLNLLQ